MAGLVRRIVGFCKGITGDKIASTPCGDGGGATGLFVDFGGDWTTLAAVGVSFCWDIMDGAGFGNEAVIFGATGGNGLCWTTADDWCNWT